VLAQALTGELPAAFACQIPGKPPTPAVAHVLSAGLATEMSADLGAPTVGTPLDGARGWLVAGWLIAHAGRFGVSTVTFGGQRWTGRTGTWVAYTPASTSVEVNG
jgi:hypothetical protein